jgi:peptidoglycan hydrolase-like protein with peptidoglycan-binding domain
MTPRQARLAACALAAACAAVWWNVLVLQKGVGEPRGRGTSHATSAAARAGTTAERATAAPQPAAARENPELSRHVQLELAQRGYDPGAVNGVVSLMTRAAVMAYEHDHGLALTGEPSEALLRAIVFGSPDSAGATRRTGGEARGHAVEVIRIVQHALTTLGYPIARVDGRLGEDTVRAIRKFEADHGLAPTGRISSPLVARLARLPGKGGVAAGR